MASLVKDRSGNVQVAFRWQERQFTRSLDTRDRDPAETSKAKVNETLMRLKRGWLSVPEGVEVGDFIVSGGTASAPVESRAETSAPAAIGPLFGRFAEDIPRRARDRLRCVHGRFHDAGPRGCSGDAGYPGLTSIAPRGGALTTASVMDNAVCRSSGAGIPPVCSRQALLSPCHYDRPQVAQTQGRTSVARHADLKTTSCHPAVTPVLQAR